MCLIFKVSGFAIYDDFVFSRFVFLGYVNLSGLLIDDGDAFFCAFIDETSWRSLQATVIELHCPVLLHNQSLGLIIIGAPSIDTSRTCTHHLLCALNGRLHKPVVGRRRGFDVNIGDQIEAILTTGLGEVDAIPFHLILPFPAKGRIFIMGRLQGG